MASLPPARAMAICPNTLDAWLDCNAAGEFPAFVAIGGPFSNAKPRVAPPRLLRKNRNARIDLAAHIALHPFLKGSGRKNSCYNLHSRDERKSLRTSLWVLRFKSMSWAPRRAGPESFPESLWTRPRWFVISAPALPPASVTPALKQP